MFTKGVRAVLIAAVTLLVLAVVLHFVLIFGRVPIYAQWGLLNSFVSTFASVVLTFFVGALLFDYQVETTEARRKEQLGSLLAAELSESIEALKRTSPVEVNLSDGSTVKVVVTHLQPLLLEEISQNGLFGSLHTEKAFSLARKMRVYNARIVTLLSILPTGSAADPAFEKMVLQTVWSVEEIRQALVEESEFLAQYRGSQSRSMAATSPAGDSRLL